MNTLSLPYKQKGYSGQFKGLNPGRLRSKYLVRLLNSECLFPHLSSGDNKICLAGMLQEKNLAHWLAMACPQLTGTMRNISDFCCRYLCFSFPQRELGPLNRCCLVYYKRKVCSHNMYLHTLEIFFLKKQTKEIAILKNIPLKISR